MLESTRCGVHYKHIFLFNPMSKYHNKIFMKKYYATDFYQTTVFL